MAKRETITNKQRSRSADTLADIKEKAKGAAKERIAELNAERASVVADFADDEDEANNLFEQAEALTNKAKSIKARLRAERDPELKRIDAELSEAASISGGRFLSDATA